MTAKSSRCETASTASSDTADSAVLSSPTASDTDTVLIAKKLSSITLAEREERQQALDRLEILKTVSSKNKSSIGALPPSSARRNFHLSVNSRTGRRPFSVSLVQSIVQHRYHDDFDASFSSARCLKGSFLFGRIIEC
jgi:hypothetical protein